MNYEGVIKDLKSKKYSSLYLFHGDEPFYVDRLTDQFINSVLSPDQREFNQSILYGKDTQIADLIGTVKRFPMMSPYQLVVLREAQEMKKIEEIGAILDQLPPTTVLVMAFKKKLDSRKKWVKKAKSVGVDFLSEKIPSWHLAGWVVKEAGEQGVSVDQKGATMLVEFLGDDLHRISNEIKKLKTLLKDGQGISAELIEKNIGISRDYNMFELQDALISRDVLKANRIIKYYAANSKTYPLQMLVPSLFSFFSKLILVHAARCKSPDEAAKVLKSRPFYAKKIMMAARNYSYRKTALIIAVLRDYDMKSKGVGSTGSTESGELMREMVFKILH